MLAEQRQHEILATLSSAGAVRVTELAKTLGVTEETIRRDLEKLDRAGRLLRTHGGALPAARGMLDVPFHVRRSAQHAAKASIARVALQHVVENDVIAVDASSTAHELALILPNIPLTVVTNALPAAAVLLPRENISVFCTGGFLHGPSRSWVGSAAEEAFTGININKLFLSTIGLDAQRGLSELDEPQARVKRRMIDLAQEVILLIDRTKLGRRAAVHLADLSAVDRVISDADADHELLRRLRDEGVPVELTTAQHNPE